MVIRRDSRHTVDFQLVMVRHHQEWAPSQKAPLAPVNLGCPSLPRYLEGTKISEEWKIPRAPANPELPQSLHAQELPCLWVMASFLTEQVAMKLPLAQLELGSSWSMEQR